MNRSVGATSWLGTIFGLMLVSSAQAQPALPSGAAMPPAAPAAAPEDAEAPAAATKPVAPRNGQSERARTREQEAKRVYVKAAGEYFESAPSGGEYAAAQSLTPANEALQIIGQIVADRASGAALEQLLTQLRKQLQCGAPTVRFPRTCQALDSVRLADLAGSGQVLLQGLIADVLALVVTQGKGLLPKVAEHDSTRNDAPVLQLTIDKIATVVLPELLRAADGKNTKAASSLIVKHLMEAALRETQLLDAKARDEDASDAMSQGSPKGRKVVASAALAFARCVSDAREDDGDPFDKCPIADYAREAAEAIGLTGESAIFAARELAADVMDALTLRKGEGPDWSGRATSSVSALFSTACLLLNRTESIETCPPVLPQQRPATWLEWFSTAHAVLLYALDRDVNGVLVGVGRALNDEQRKGLRLLGGVVRYAQTYTDKSENKDAHAQRVELLEDLTSEMTDRTGREGDGVWSLGGSLQFVVGARAPLEEDENGAFYGPIALPIGFGYQDVGGGLHFALGVVDLGQYVSWKPGLEVAKPSVEDALSPSLAIGRAWGKSFPLFIAASVSYAPHYRFSDTASRGSLNIGMVFGAYVPLIDFN